MKIQTNCPELQAILQFNKAIKDIMNDYKEFLKAHNRLKAAFNRERGK